MDHSCSGKNQKPGFFLIKVAPDQGMGEYSYRSFGKFQMFRVLHDLEMFSFGLANKHFNLNCIPMIWTNFSILFFIVFQNVCHSTLLCPIKARQCLEALFLSTGSCKEAFGAKSCEAERTAAFCITRWQYVPGRAKAGHCTFWTHQMRLTSSVAKILESVTIWRRSSIFQIMLGRAETDESRTKLF